MPAPTVSKPTVTKPTASGSAILAIGILLLLLGLQTMTARAASVYWSDSTLEVIERADLDGGNRQVVLSGLDYPEGLVVDPANDRIYWVEGSGRLRRARLDGSEVETILEGVGVPAGLALGSDAGKLYWTDVAVGTVWRANVDGTDLEQIAALAGHTRGIAIDPDAGKIYISGGENTKVQRVDLDGSNVEDVMLGVANPVDVALDVASERVYVATSTGVYRSSFTGEDFESVIGSPASGLALDPAGGRLYASALDGTVWSATLEGTDFRMLVDEGPERPRHLTLDLPDVSSAPSPVDRRVPLRAEPNPFVTSTRIEYGARLEEGVGGAIHDASGRRVRLLVHEAGHSFGSFLWDGRDDRGNPLPSGAYLFAIREGDRIVTTRLIRVR